jgi:peptidoglycan-N-acetylglucosamine deacetylase
LKNLRKLIAEPVKKRVAPIARVTTDKPYVALTFDDSPDPNITPILLNLLERFNARATFFAVGAAATKNRSLIDEIASRGHEVGNHTMDHVSMRSVDRKERERQIRLCREVLSPYGAKYFRPPYGEQTIWTNLDVMRMGYRVIGWDLNVGDWCNTDVSLMSADLKSRMRKGSILLFHDALYDGGRPKHKEHEQKSNLDRTVTVELVKFLLEEFTGRFQFVSIDYMLKHGKPVREQFLR